MPQYSVCNKKRMFLFHISPSTFIFAASHPYISGEDYWANAIKIRMTRYIRSTPIKLAPHAVSYGPSVRNHHRINYIDGPVIFGNGCRCTEWLLACTYLYRFLFERCFEATFYGSVMFNTNRYWVYSEIRYNKATFFLNEIFVTHYIESKTKWLPFCKLHLKADYLIWKLLCFDSN